MRQAPQNPDNSGQQKESSMRKWHRWLSLFFGIFMLWMSVTGVLSQIVPLTQSRPDEGKALRSSFRRCNLHSSARLT
jgi:hypothetical protein